MIQSGDHRSGNQVEPDTCGMDDGLALPWWDYTPEGLALPGSVVNIHDVREEEATVAAFLLAGSRPETAARFLAGAVCLT